jgi:polyhydroxyalkanoate synthesis regulator phasin
MKMHHEAIDTLLKALAQALAPYMVESVIDHLGKNGMLTTEVDTRIEDWMSNNFHIDDHVDIEEKVTDYLSDRLHNMVRDEARELSFSVTVD